MALTKLLTVIGVLVLIALATTAGSLAFQAKLGRSHSLAAPIIAAVAAAAFAFFGVRRV